MHGELSGEQILGLLFLAAFMIYVVWESRP